MLRSPSFIAAFFSLFILGSSTSALAAPGDVLAAFPINNISGDGRAPTTPQGIEYYDGYLWVVDFGTDRLYRVYPNTVYDEDEVTVLFNPGDSDFNIPLPDVDNPPINSDGNPIGSCFNDSEGNPQYCGGGGLTFAENFLWNASPVTDDIIKIDPVDGDNLESENALSSLAFPSPTDMTFDGTHFWAVDWQSNTINQVLPEDGTILSTLSGPSSLPAYDVNPSVTTARPFGITWDGRAFWVSDQEEQRIYRVSRDDGSLLNFFDSPGADPKGLAWDGEFLWHVDQATQTIYKLESGVIPFGVIGCLEKNGRAVDGDVLLSQTAEPDQALVTDADGCFIFPNFTSGIPIQVKVSESGVDEKPIITLTETSPGNTEVVLIVGETYTEPGYVATDTEDGNITFDVVATPDVINTPALIDTSVPTSYSVAYDVIDSAGNQADTVYRTVTVLEVDTTPPIITLLGDNPLAVEQGSTFTEPGYTATDDRDGDITGAVTVTGTVDANTAGTYFLTYDVSDSTGNAATTVTRTVNVVDTTIPVITLNGITPVTHERGDAYTDLGASATDNIDGDISGSINVTGSVTDYISGSYVLNYDVSDSAGNAAVTVTRIVNVTDTTLPVLTLLGTTPVLHELNTPYTDDGATASDYPGDDLTADIVVTGTVDTSIAGSYTLTYDVSDAAGNAAVSITREVIVGDRTAPVITLIGDDPLAWEQLTDPFVEPGYTATDAIDGDITGSVVIGGDTVNPNVAGTYVITYDATDSAGNAATQVTRTVNVTDTTPPTITLSGLANVDHELQTPYTDAGATASDNLDGDISLNIAVTGSVDANTIGVYVLTYNVSDAAGNAAAPVTRIIDVADRTIPVITLLGANPLNHEVGTIYNDPGATAADIIDGDITGNIGVTGTVDANTIGSYVLTYNVSDAAGNAATTVTRTVNVEDTGAPTITLLGDSPILHELQTPFTDPGATALDAADGDVTASIVTTGTVDPNIASTYTLTYNVSDSQGNAAPTVTRDVIVADRTAPTITLIGADPLYHEQGTTFTDPGATASDVIDGDISGSILVTGSVDVNVRGTYTLTYNISDAAGNPATTVTRDVIVQDTTIPTITLVGANPLQHEVDTVFVDPGATAADNIDGDISGSIGVSGTVDAATIGSYILSYNVQDSAGNNATTVTRTVNVVDTGAPTIVILGDNPLNHELNTLYTDPGATASDAADGDVTASIVTVNNVNANLTGTYTVTYDVSDSQSNAATQQVRTVNVADRTAPVITLTGADPYYHEQGTAFVDPGSTASDIIDGDITASIVITGTVDINTQGSYTLSYNVSDAAGNAATTVTREVIVQDTTIPVITLSGANPLQHEVDTVFVDPGATASDNIDGDITANIGVTGTVDAATIGSYTLTYNVQDSSGNNATTVTRTVNVVDTGAPAIALNGDNPVLHELQTPYTDAGATASDAADGDLTASIIVTGSVDTNIAGTYTLSYNVQDSQGNPAPTVTRDVIVADRTAPTINLVGGSSIQHEQGTIFTDPGYSATDIIDGDVTASVAVTGTVDVNVPGIYTLTYDVSDAAGNAATSVLRNVTVTDTTIPVITLTGSNPLQHEVDTVFTDPGATATDNIDGDISGSIGVIGTVDATTIGSYTLTYNVQDAAGNSATTVTRTVNVVDTGAPAITLIGSNPILHELQTVFTDPGATASDAADGDLTASIIVTGSVDPNTAGTYTLTYNVQDSQGNPAPTVTRDVIVADRNAPVITLTGSDPHYHEQGSVFTDPGYTANDIIDGDITASVVVTGTVDVNTQGTYTLSYNVSDTAGNTATTVTRDVIVQDTTIPVITLVGANPLQHEVDTVFTDPGATAADNIDGDISASIGVSGSVDAATLGSYTLTYNVQDSSSNAATTVTRTVNVVDTGAPTISLIGNNPILHELKTPFTDPGATASDAADGDLTGSIIVTGTVDPNTAGTYTLTYNVQDSQGNPAPTVTRDVIVADRLAPTITLVGSDPLNQEQGTAFTDPGATASDINDGDVSGSIVVTGTVNANVAGTYILSYNVSDSAGNAATTVTRNVIVSDTTVPVITLISDNPLNHEVNTVFVDPGATAADNIDGDISASITVTGTVNANLIGSYSLTYNVLDSSGNAAVSVVRTVNVADTGAPVISITGANPINHEINTAYVDPGATASDAVDGDLTASIVTVNNVVDTVEGTYTVTYDVTDSNSNPAAQRVRTVNVGDFTPPVISILGSGTVNVEQGTSYTDAGATASDNTDGDITANIVQTGTVDPLTAGTYFITYDVSDSSGNNATQVVRTVIVSDTTAPTITLTGADPLQHEQGTAFSDPGATAIDNIDGDISGSITVSGSVNVNVAGSYTLTYNVSDAAGNNATTVQRTVNVVDTTAPVITLVGVNPINHEQGTAFTDPGATATDSVEGNLTASIVVTGTVNINLAGTYTLSYNVQDSQGNAATTVTRDVIVADTTAPVISIIGSTTVNVEQGSSYADAGATASDNIDGDITASIVTTGSVNPSVAGTYFIRYDVTDAAGNSATQAVRTVIVSDTTVPVITLIGADPLTHSQGTAFSDPGATASDNIDGDISANIVVSGSVNVNAAGSYVLSYNVSDAAGNNATTVTRTVNVEDTGAPTITLLGANPILHELQTAFTDPGATASDAIDGDLTASIVVTGTVDPNTAGTYTLTYNVQDSQGNPAPTVTRDVIVADRTAPVITITGSTTVNVEQGSSYTDDGATASDNIDGNLTASIVQTGSVDVNTAGTYFIRYDVTDSAGNAATQAVRTVVVSDNTKPVITVQGANPLNHEQGTAYSDPGASANDNIDGDISASVTITGFVDANVAGSYILTYNVTDASGNSADSVSRTVNVADTTAPTISLIGSNPINHEQGTLFTDPGATANDTVDGNISASIVVTGSVNVNIAGTYTLTYNVSDTAGNAATTVTRDVIVADTTAPVITLTGSAIVNHEQGTSYTDAGATASDSVDGNITASIVVTGSVNVNVAGTYTLTYNASDAAGNSATAITRDVVVADTTAPVITLNGSDPVNHEQGTLYVDAGAGASDNIDGDISGSIIVTGSVNVNVAGSYVISYNVTDAAGNNATTVTRTVNVNDTTAPVISLVGSSTINHEQGTAFSDPGYTASDNIDGDVTASVVVGGDTVDANTAGTYVITYNVADVAGNNATTVNRTVIVADTAPPVITLIGSDPLNHEQGTAFSDPGATATDTVDGNVSASIVITGSVDINTAGTYTLNYNVADAAGNNAVTVTRDVIVADTIAPTITLTGSATITHPQGQLYNDQGATATDSVDGDLTASIVVTGSVNVNIPGDYVLSYNVSDSAGNGATEVTRTVTVADITPPEITLVGAGTINHEQGTTFTDPGAGASDDIDGDISGSIIVTGSVNENVAGTYFLNYNVTDAAGNSADTVTRTVNVVDTIPPVITLIGADPLAHEQGTAFVDPGITATDSVDGDISGSVVVTGSVDINTAGSYVLSYDVTDAGGNNATTVTRTVNVADTTAPVVTLTGSNPINHEQGTPFTDPGATATDTVDGTFAATASGSVNSNVAGNYILSYDASDAAGNNATTVTRDVIVADTTIPVITLQGGSTIDHPIGQLFIDPGYTATDNIDGDITGNVATSGAFDINTEGTYVLSYDVADAGGNNAVTVQRTVNVVTPTVVTLEAETGTIGGTATVASTEIGFNGSGYVDMTTASAGEYLEYSSVTTYAVPYDLTIRYAGTDSITVEIILNSGSVGTIDLTSSGGTGVWQSSASLTINPLSGSNTIRLNFVGASATNVDTLVITPQ